MFIAVGTPPSAEDGHADLAAVFAVASLIATHMSSNTVIVTKSTVPVGTGDEIERIVREKAGAKKIAVVSNPEFLREGSAVSDFLNADRIVVGTTDSRVKLCKLCKKPRTH